MASQVPAAARKDLVGFSVALKCSEERKKPAQRKTKYHELIDS